MEAAAYLRAVFSLCLFIANYEESYVMTCYTHDSHLLFSSLHLLPAILGDSRLDKVGSSSKNGIKEMDSLSLTWLNYLSRF